MTTTRTQRDRLCSCGQRFSNKATLMLHVAQNEGHEIIRYDRRIHGQENAWAKEKKRVARSRQAQTRRAKRGHGKAGPKGG